MERPESTSPIRSGEELERFNEKKPAEISEVSSGIAGSDTAMRMGLEFVFSVLIPAGAGLFLDHMLGSSPFLMVIGLFLGAAAGFRVLIRSSAPSKSASETTSNGDGKK